MEALIFVDDRPCSCLRPCSLNYALLRRADVVPILLRVDGESLGREYLAATAHVSSFYVDMGNPISIEVGRFRKWCEAGSLSPAHFCCMSEPRQEFWQHFARSLGLGALSGEVARALRHKPTMKEWIRRCGLSTVTYAEVVTPVDISTFAAEFGYPIVVKPVDGFGARDTFVIHSSDNFDRFSHLISNKSMMVEQYVSDREYECCALINNGEVLDIFPSIMPVSPAEAAHGALNANISVGRHHDRIPVPNLKSVVQKLVNGFELSRGYLHLELFASDDSLRLVISELALRYPGCEIAKNHGLALGFDMAQVTLDLYLGRTPDLTYSRDSCVGDLLLPYRSGHVENLISADRLQKFPGVLEVHIGVKIGDLLPGLPPASFNCSGWVIVEGRDPDEVEARMRHVLEAYQRELRVVPAVDQDNIGNEG